MFFFQITSEATLDDQHAGIQQLVHFVDSFCIPLYQVREIELVDLFVMLHLFLNNCSSMQRLQSGVQLNAKKWGSGRKAGFGGFSDLGYFHDLA